MHANRWALVAAVLVLAPIDASAQNAQQEPPAPNHWLVSGFVGSNFANNAQPASMDFGGSLAYLWKDRFGAEIDTGFTPDFQLQNNFFGLGIKPQVNSYMVNLMGARAIGDERTLLPFISGGIGALSLRSGLASDAVTATTSNDTRFGGDIGGGVMGFSGAWGFKADVRYFRATGSYNAPGSSTTSGSNPGMPTPPGPYGINTSAVPGATAATPSTGSDNSTSSATSLAGAALAGLHFWRANVGVAVRW